MIKSKLLIVTLSLLLLSTVTTAQGNKNKNKDNKNWNSSNNSVGKWERIGTQTVQKSGEKDEFRPSNRNSFSALKVKVRRNTVSFNRMTIIYENGQRQNVELRNVMRDGEESRVINLKHKRRIDRIQFYYKTRNLAGSRAQVEVWARR